MNIEELDISVIVYSCLKRGGINTIEQLCNMSMDDIIKIRNLGRRSFEELLSKMKELGLEFNGE